jgi:hypothetical protein
MNQEALLDHIYNAVADFVRWPEALVHIADRVDSIGAMLRYNSPPNGRNLLVLGRLDPQYNEIFHKYYVWNPWTPAVKLARCFAKMDIRPPVELAPIVSALPVDLMSFSR